MTAKSSLSLHFLQNDPVEALLITSPDTGEALMNKAFRKMFKMPDLTRFDDILPYICPRHKDRKNLEEIISKCDNSRNASSVKVKINNNRFHLHVYCESEDNLVVLHARSRAEFDLLSAQLNEYAEGLVQNIFDLAVSERALMQSKNRLSRQLKASSELGLTSNENHKDIDVVFSIFSRNALSALDVSRCGIWQMEENGKKLKAADIFISSDKSHLADIFLQENDFPKFFAAVSQERIIQSVDVAADAVTAELYEKYFKPAGIAAALIVSVMLKGKVAGIVSFENTVNRTWEEDEIGFAVMFADHVARILADAERDKLETQLVQSQKMETIGTLAGGLAHDFNNVLAGIVGITSIIKFKINSGLVIPPAMLADYVETIDKSGQRAKDMVQQLLSISRKQEITFAPIDLNLSIKHVLNICANTIDKAVELRSIPAPQSAMVSAAPVQIEQVILNLCINASHAMTIMREKNESYGGILTISIRKYRLDKYFCSTHVEAKEDTDYWIVSVQDTGVGIGPKIASKIFDPFFTTKEKGKGTGLGLAMVYNIINQHGGFITVYSEIGQGSTFNIYLPCLDVEFQKDAVPKLEEIKRGKGVILIVDDEIVIRDLARVILEDCGYSVLVACDGEEAVDVFKKAYEQISMVILDLVMPKKSGKEAYFEMKQIDSNVKVLVNSGYKNDPRVDDMMGAGAKGFIQKPYTLNDLSTEVHRIITESS